MAESQKEFMGISYAHPNAFRYGAATVTLGVLLHLPFYFAARHDHYRLAGKSPNGPMMIGMGLIFVGLAATVYGLLPPLSHHRRHTGPRIRVRALDDAPITPSHIALLCVMAAAVTIDVMKPTTLAFIAPGAAREYALRSPLNPHARALSIALYPLSGIGGTVIGSFLWGWLGDRIGRRASILLADRRGWYCRRSASPGGVRWETWPARADYETPRNLRCDWSWHVRSRRSGRYRRNALCPRTAGFPASS